MTIDDVINWSYSEEQEGHIRSHRLQIMKVLESVPPGSEKMRLLDMGSYLQMAPACRYHLNYGEVMACFKGKGRRSAIVHSRAAQEFHCYVDNFDAEKENFPYENDFFDTVICSEVLPYLQLDPMWMLYELNRVIKMGGILIMTAPNCNSVKSAWKVLNGFNPGLFPNYIISGDPRLAREYTAQELRDLLHAGGFEVQSLTGTNYGEPFSETDMKLIEVLQKNWFPELVREECLVAVAAKSFAPQDRYPKWLYY